MSLVSVIMSIYNEPLSYIKESVDSILKQTLTDFEYIIVNDNPTRGDIKDYLLSFQDKRIKFIQNEYNIGLAESMNKAVLFSQSPYLARMDADDIAVPNRIEEEYEVINQGRYDLVFSAYSCIDAEANPVVTIPHSYYTPEELPRKILVESVIHHPTVMMTREIFNRVGGYRNFPCAQDADMWLRMLYAGCRFYMIPKVLHKYRINPESVSAKKWYMQKLTIYYINDLFIQRLKKGEDDFSFENYKKYLENNEIGNEREAQKLRRAFDFLERGAEYSFKKKRILAIVYRVEAFVCSEKVRKNYKKTVIKKILFNRVDRRNGKNISDNTNI